MAAKPTQHIVLKFSHTARWLIERQPTARSYSIDEILSIIQGSSHKCLRIVFYTLNTPRKIFYLLRFNGRQALDHNRPDDDGFGENPLNKTNKCECKNINNRLHINSDKCKRREYMSMYYA